MGDDIYLLALCTLSQGLENTGALFVEELRESRRE